MWSLGPSGFFLNQAYSQMPEKNGLMNRAIKIQVYQKKKFVAGIPFFLGVSIRCTHESRS
jgi:hypothetical protein